MAKSQETWNKKEREKKKQRSRQDKADKKQERKDHAKEGGKSLNDMMAYVDENGHIIPNPPDPRKKIKVNVEDIQIGVPKQTEYTQAELTRTGRVTFFNEAKGFGFIKDMETQESIFVHLSGLAEEVNENDKVTFEIEMGPRGANAINVKKAV